jgi:spore germination cell wall hydrolase CwlJ-like protein
MNSKNNKIDIITIITCIILLVVVGNFSILYQEIFCSSKPEPVVSYTQSIIETKVFMPEASIDKYISDESESLSDEDRYVIECIVAGEARGEGTEGQMWVATCIYNAMQKDGLTPLEVKTIYKYSGWYENVSDEVKESVSRVFDNGEIVNDNVLYFYAYKTTKSSWHETQDYITTIGGHKFFAKRGTI